MRKFLIGLGAIFLGLIVIGSVIFLIAAHDGKRLDAESKAYVDQIVPEIAQSWNIDDFYRHASPELAAAAPRDKLEPLFAALTQRLGPLKEYQGSTGDSNVSYNMPKGKLVTARYSVKISCEKAAAVVEIRTIEHHNEWQILYFHVNSDALLP